MHKHEQNIVKHAKASRNIQKKQKEVETWKTLKDIKSMNTKQ